MAITTYSELLTAGANWLQRSDLTSRFPEFLALAEASLNRRLRCRQMETSATLTPASGSVTLPTDYLDWRRVTWAGDTRVELQYVTPTYLQARFTDTPSGTPTIFTIEGSTLKVRPTSTTSLEFDYWQKIPALTSTATTNWLLTAYPDLYLFAVLVEANAYTRNPVMGPVWKARRDEILGEIEQLDNAGKGRGAIMPIGVAIV